MDRMSSDLKIAAQRELGETLQVKRNAVEQLRKRLAEEPELQCPLDEEFLVKFLRGRKYRVEEAFENIRKYFRVRMDHADIFDNLLPSRIMFDTIFHQKKLVTILKKPDSLGRRILLVKFGAWDPQVCPLNEYFRAGIVVLECGLLNQMAQIAGVVGVADLDGLKISHLLYFTPSEIRKLIKLVQECYPLRLKGVYVVNNPALFELLFAVAKLFLKPKLLKRFRFIGRDYEKLHKLIPRDRLPEEYGGTLEPFDYEDYERSLRSQENYFVELGRYGYREKHSENESRDSA
ncbi:alpha-tocopherol transfer protein-like isoform X1 [Ixodes scapularis]|uniref:alpha-tocopherol transfer protein-like isoform X1 n=1 Tax=Ixodes scapularis TaxID=6945 RepID=UPI001A9E4D98|nr:alpha-tocopherol transfer protein-like isoform X1 [Ixodes scapularis]XP_040074151.1 alpha-tocopherol transfer protein-like isoform X1 [Ixodes scapularis]XP_040074152.1 alpha-tocopherol transfer protein-like isoform X1 [Ixodes scapularis]XP_040074153.1 alpha-tocopherol transfer protein-like isoform X1 [Ixodes scapularis]